MRYSRPRAFASFRSGTKLSSKSTRFSSIDSFGLRPTKPQTAGAPSAAAASKQRTMKACLLRRAAGSSCSMLSKYPMSATCTPVASTARWTRRVRSASNGSRRSSVLATGSSMASAGTSASLGCRAAESWMQSASRSRAKASQSSIARSGSASRCARGVSSCRAAVSTPSGMNCGSKARVVIVRLRVREAAQRPVPRAGARAPATRGA